MNFVPHHHYPWTPADEETLIQLKRQGLRHKVIARDLQRTPGSVDAHVHRLQREGRIAVRIRKDELKLLNKVLREASQPEWHSER